MSQDAPTAVIPLCSTMAGVVEGVVVQPLDMLKTRQQLRETIAMIDDVPRRYSLLSDARAIVKEGGFARFYRGCLPELAGMVPKTSAMYSTYEIVRRELTTYYSPVEKECTFWMAGIAGFASGYSESITVCPFQVVKVRMQALEYLGRYKDSWHCTRSIIREEGISTFMTGLGPTCWRNCVWNTVYFASMFEIRKRLPTLDDDQKMLKLGQTLIAGFCGGMFATCFNAPFDVVKSRFQRQMDKGPTRQYRYTLQSLAHIYSTEGFRGCYKGFVPKAWRMGIGGAVCMGAFEAFCLVFVHFGYRKKMSIEMSEEMQTM